MHNNPSLHVQPTWKSYKTGSLVYSDTSALMDIQLDDVPISNISHNTPLLVMDLVLQLPNIAQMLDIRPCDGLQSYTWYTILFTISPFIL